jgi:elongation factor G
MPASTHPGTDTQRGGELAIKAQAPLAELTDYPTELKSMTGGRSRYSLDLSHYEAVPPAVQKQLGAAWKPKVEEE